MVGDDLTAADYASAATSHVRDIGEKLNGLKVNELSVTQLGGQFCDHGFNERARVPAGALVDGDQVFTLDGPGIENAEQRVERATIVDAIPKILTLW